MSQTKSGNDELVKFINETRAGKYGDISYDVEECQRLRFDVAISETVNDSFNNVILYGISHG